MAGFVKIHSTILQSTIWLEDHATFRVWITLLAMSDAGGRVDGTVPGLAHTARVTLEECEHALERFAGPDKYSRTDEGDGGRRIEAVDGGWLLLNYGKYREKSDKDERLRQNREAQQRRREKVKAAGDDDEVSTDADASSEVSTRHQGQQESAQAEAEAEGERGFDDGGPVDKLGGHDSARAHRESLRRREAIERGELQRRAATIPMRDPLAAIHDPETVAIVATSPPAGSRAWGPSDAAEVHRQLRARGVAHVRAVVDFIRNSIEARRRYPGRNGEYVPAAPKNWSDVWKHDADAWTRWEQRYAEAEASPPAPAAGQGEQPAESETDPEPLLEPDDAGPDEAERARIAAAAQSMVDKLAGAKSIGGDDA